VEAKSNNQGIHIWMDREVNPLASNYLTIQ
jgi:hypothetical protein